MRKMHFTVQTKGGNIIVEPAKTLDHMGRSPGVFFDFTSFGGKRMFVPLEDPLLDSVLRDSKHLNPPAFDLSLTMLEHWAKETGDGAKVALEFVRLFEEKGLMEYYGHSVTEQLFNAQSVEQAEEIVVQWLRVNNLSLVCNLLHALGDDTTFEKLGEIRPAVFKELFALFEKLARHHGAFDAHVGLIIEQLPPELYKSIDGFATRLLTAADSSEYYPETGGICLRIMDRLYAHNAGVAVASNNSASIFREAQQIVLDQMREILDNAVKLPQPRSGRLSFVL